MAFSTSLPKVFLFSASRSRSTVTTRLRFGSRWRRRSSFRFGASSQAPSTLPLFLSTTCTVRAKSCDGSSGTEKVSTRAAAPSSWISDASSRVSVLPMLSAASFSSVALSGFAGAEAGAGVEVEAVAVAGAAEEVLSSLSSQPTSVMVVSSANDSAARRNGFILYPWPCGPVGRRRDKYYPQVSLIQKCRFQFWTASRKVFCVDNILAAGAITALKVTCNL